LVLLRAVQLLQCAAGNIPYLYIRTVRDTYLTKYLLSIGLQFVTLPGQVASRAGAFGFYGTGQSKKFSGICLEGG
jgi:hypothetical protein